MYRLFLGKENVLKYQVNNQQPDYRQTFRQRGLRRWWRLWT